MSWFKKNLKELRQEKVAYWRARGLSQRAIVEKLSAPVDDGGLRNPETDLPYTEGAIAQDFLALDAMWQAEAMKSTAEHKARILLELAQVRQAAWEMGDAKGLTLVLKALARESLMLGLNEVQVHAFNMNVDFNSLSDEQIRRLADGEDPFAVLGQAPAQVVEGEVVSGSRGLTGEIAAHESCSIEDKSSHTRPNSARSTGSDWLPWTAPWLRRS